MSTLDDWAAAVVSELGLPAGADVRLVLDLARDIAHGVERPAAPLTTWLAGMAVARGADPADVAARLSALAASWES
ncbi:MAG: hypothetical protein JWN35_3856 [Frankiales bacterium]|nr:hypothetical protein [Frankiales bacterium]